MKTKFQIKIWRFEILFDLTIMDYQDYEGLYFNRKGLVNNFEFSVNYYPMED